MRINRDGHGPDGRRVYHKGGGLLGAVLGGVAGYFLGPMAALGTTTAAGTAMMGASLGSTLAGGMVKQPAQQADLPTPQAPTAPPASQAAQQPDSQVVRQNVAGTGQGGGSPGIASTLLTKGGVDPSMLTLGKNTLLGM